jgi:HEAT repeat protein
VFISCASGNIGNPRSIEPLIECLNDDSLDTYSHVVPGLQEAAAKRFDEVFNTRYNELADEMVR